jgi:hypothetical protein
MGDQDIARPLASEKNKQKLINIYAPTRFKAVFE